MATCQARQSDHLTWGTRTSMRGCAERVWIGAAMTLCVAGTLGLVGCRGGSDVPEESVGAATTTSAPEEVAAESPLGPHGGRLLSIPERRGQIEWVMNEVKRHLRVYFLTLDDRPLESVSEPFLMLGSSAGPKILSLADCGDPQFPNACWQVATEDVDWPGSRTEMLIRFVVAEEGFRLRLPAPDRRP